MVSHWEANKLKPGATWNEKDKRYYMDGERERLRSKKDVATHKSD